MLAGWSEDWAAAQPVSAFILSLKTVSIPTDPRLPRSVLWDRHNLDSFGLELDPSFCLLLQFFFYHGLQHTLFPKVS